MKCSGTHLFTPIYLKLTDAMPWPPEERAFYLLSRDGLFLCRNTPLFSSCVPVECFPTELAGQRPFLKLSYPLVPQRLLEQVVGFFDLVAARYRSEAIVLIAWNRDSEEVEILVPEQIGIVGVSYYGDRYPLELEYEVPPLPPHLTLLGDIHSHADGLAYSSCTDKSDEVHQPGLHLVVGRILEEPPQFYCEATADGFRFRVPDRGLVLEGYHRRRVSKVATNWLDKVTIKPWSSRSSGVAKSVVPSLSGSSSTRGADGAAVEPSGALKDLEVTPRVNQELPRPAPSAVRPAPKPLADERATVAKVSPRADSSGPRRPASSETPTTS